MMTRYLILTMNLTMTLKGRMKMNKFNMKPLQFQEGKEGSELLSPSMKNMPIAQLNWKLFAWHSLQHLMSLQRNPGKPYYLMGLIKQFGTDKKLPKYIEVNRGGFMRLRVSFSFNLENSFFQEKERE